ncbi:MAG: hypothetical protein AB7O26_20365 [Planctomycetaceae bacterium]
MFAPAAQVLEGKSLGNGWTVREKITRPPNSTGGHFSTGYIVEHDDGRIGYLKALDYSSAFGYSDFADRVKVLADAFIFERDICLKCQNARISRVVHAVEHGSDFGSMPPMTQSDYLIFERADGDVRKILDELPAFDAAFALRTLHGVAAALRQMHAADMAHQDLKPSNVLMFMEEGVSKLGDLGRSWAKDIPAPHDGCAIAGQRSYAPVELLYGLTLDQNERRFGCDLYLLGSLVVFMFSRVHINALLQKHLDPALAPAAGTSYQDSLPFLQSVFNDALDEFASTVPECCRAELRGIVRELCDPDFNRRGNQVSSGLRRYALDRYVSIFDRLAKMVEIKI